MRKKRAGRLVYSTEPGVGACTKCGWPTQQCRCSANLEETVPEEVVARLSIEKSGRKGKTVTIVAGLPRNREFLAGLAKELKQNCGSGGSFRDDRVEIQGEKRDGIRKRLVAKGWIVKG